MKKIAFLGLLLSSTVFATNLHVHPQHDPKDASFKKEKMSYPGYCQLEVLNTLPVAFYVNGQFDDGSYLPPFYVNPYEPPHYISLYYHGYCHQSMQLSITTTAPVHSTIRIGS